MVELVAPKVGGVTLSDGSHRSTPHHASTAGPSVLFDAVAILPSDEGAALLAGEAAARDFVADAFAHAKFIAVRRTAAPLLEKAGVEQDNGIFAIDGKDVDAFVQACAALASGSARPRSTSKESACGRHGGCPRFLLRPAAPAAGGNCRTAGRRARRSGSPRPSPRSSASTGCRAG